MILIMYYFGIVPVFVGILQSTVICIFRTMDNSDLWSSRI